VVPAMSILAAQPRLRGKRASQRSHGF